MRATYPAHHILPDLVIIVLMVMRISYELPLHIIYLK
jgi:hypothetical protein